MTQNGDFKKYVQHLFQMRQITQNQVVNTYWNHIEEIDKFGFVAFVIRGSLQWKTETKKRIISETNYVWLQSDYYDPVGKSMFSHPVKNYLQLHLNQYDIWGGIQVQVDSQNAQTTKERLVQAIHDISLLCNLISLTTQTSLTWFPARYVEVSAVNDISDKKIPAGEESSRQKWICVPLPRQQVEMTSAVVADDYIVNGLFPLFHAIMKVGHKEITVLLRRSIAWHAIGNFIGSGLNRFLNYWEAVELLAHYFYRRLPAKIINRPAKSDRKAQIIEVITQHPVTLSNCLDIADKLANIIRPSIKTEMQAVIPILVGSDDLAEEFFRPDDKIHKSLYDIRNDIAHGNYCDHDLEFTEIVEQRLNDMCVFSRKVILETLNRLESIDKLLMSS